MPMGITKTRHSKMPHRITVGGVKVGQRVMPSTPKTTEMTSVPAYHHSETAAGVRGATHEARGVHTFRVRRHQAVVNIEVFVFHRLRVSVSLLLPEPQPLKEALEARLDLESVIYDDVRDQGRVDGEEAAVDEGVGRADVGVRVLTVLLLVVHATVVQGGGYIVGLAEVVEDLVGVDGEVTRVPDIAVPNHQDEKPRDEHAAHCVEGGKGWNNLLCFASAWDTAEQATAESYQRVGAKGNHVPVKGRKGVEQLKRPTCQHRRQVVPQTSRLTPRPFCMPVRMFSSRLLGEIQVIHEKYMRTWTR